VLKVLGQLVAEINQNCSRLNAGIHGTKFVLNALSENGRTDVAYTLAVQTKYPSWGYWIKQGATTLWETWDGAESLNHIMYGDISAWAYKYLAGIQLDPKKPGFKNIIIRPELVEGLTQVKASHRSMYGPICVSWKLSGSKFSMEVEVPCNTTAEIHLPCSNAGSVTKNGISLKKIKEIKVVKCGKGSIVLKIGSGKYSFSCKVKK